MSTTQNTPQTVQFKGKTKEWFGIWIVNLLLSIITLGVYAAWAKVRTKKYFYNNTYVEDRNFDYHATGEQIFIGRLIVIGSMIILQLLLNFSPILGLILTLSYLCIIPWLIIRSLMFNARMSSFSNVRFNFNGKPLYAAFLFLIAPILVFLTAYTTAPLLHRAVKKFTVDGHSYGHAQFSFTGRIWEFYKALFAALAWIAFVVALSALFFEREAFMEFVVLTTSPESDPVQFLKFIGLLYGFVFFAFIPAGIIYTAFIRNAVFNNTILADGSVSFVSDINPFKYIWIIVSNAVITLCSLGLLLPWAHIRHTRYLAAHTAIISSVSLDSFVGNQQEEASALGDAYSDIEGIDFGLV